MCAEVVGSGRSEHNFVQLTDDHIERLLEIERVSFINPWSAADFCCVVGDRSARCVGLVYREELIGYAIGYVVGREFHLANFAVVPKHRRCGWASALLQHIIAQVCCRGCRRCTLEVRLSNRGAVDFYARHGFYQIGVRPHYYENPPENALIMQRRIEMV